MNISVLGSGRWGSFLAWYTSVTLGYKVCIWGRNTSQSFASLKDNRKNEYVTIPDNVIFTNDINEALAFSDVILISITSQYLRDLCNTIKNCTDIYKSKTFVLCMKGLEEESGMRLTQVVEDVLSNEVHTAIWIGPGHAENMTKGVPNCMLIDSNNDDLTRDLVHVFGSPLIRFYYGQDIIGNEVGAASKNVIGIAAGILDGIDKPSLKGILMARGPYEISKLVTAMGGNFRTVYGLSHLGDYEATLFSPYSKNRRHGEMIMQGKTPSFVAEGVSTARSLHLLSNKYKVELPICTAVYDALEGIDSPDQHLLEMFKRTIKYEFE